MTEHSAKDSQLVVAASLPRRKSIRMKGWDFRSPGWYFLTICTKGMKSVFGTIVKGRMILNDAGRTADQFWREIPTHFPRAVVDEYVQYCNRLVIGHLNPEGMLACILAEADPCKEIIYL